MQFAINSYPGAYRDIFGSRRSRSPEETQTNFGYYGSGKHESCWRTVRPSEEEGGVGTGRELSMNTEVGKRAVFEVEGIPYSEQSRKTGTGPTRKIIFVHTGTLESLRVNPDITTYVAHLRDRKLKFRVYYQGEEVTGDISARNPPREAMFR